MGLDGGLSIDACIKQVRRQKSDLRRIERHADVILAYPLHAHLHARPILRTTAIGMPYARARAASSLPRRRDGAVTLLHAPSHSEGKGTDRIRASVNELQRKGHSIRYVEIVGRPNADVLRALAECDLVVDQVYSDGPISGLATEAAFQGRPAVIGGYAGGHLDRFVPVSERLPSRYCPPSELTPVLEELVRDRAQRLESARRAADFVERHWQLVDVASRFLAAVEGRAPADWYADPTRLRYLHGWGLSESRLREVLRAVLERGGASALMLADKPELERRFVEFAQMNDAGND